MARSPKQSIVEQFQGQNWKELNCKGYFRSLFLWYKKMRNVCCSHQHRFCVGRRISVFQIMKLQCLKNGTSQRKSDGRNEKSFTGNGIFNAPFNTRKTKWEQFLHGNDLHQEGNFQCTFHLSQKDQTVCRIGFFLLFFRIDVVECRFEHWKTRRNHVIFVQCSWCCLTKRSPKVGGCLHCIVFLFEKVSCWKVARGWGVYRILLKFSGMITWLSQNQLFKWLLIVVQWPLWLPKQQFL